MLKALCLVLCCWVSTVSVAQDYAISALKMNLFYKGIANPISIAVENVKAEDVIVKTDNGKLEPTDEKNVYWVWPETYGKAIITLLSKNGDTIGRSKFRVKRIPPPKAMIAGINGGDLGKNILKAQIGISAAMAGFDFDYGAKVTEYTLIILRGNNAIFSKHFNDGPMFNNEAKQAFNYIQSGDKVIFCYIKYMTLDKKIHKADPIEFTIID